MNTHHNRLKHAYMALVASSAVALLSSAIAQTPGTIGFNFSDGRAVTRLAGKTADGCTNWVDSYPTADGFSYPNFSGISFGTRTLASGAITAQWNSAQAWSAGTSSNSQQQLYFWYLDDSDGDPVPNDNIGPRVTLSGLRTWLAANQATNYRIRLYHTTDWDLIQLPSNTTASIRLGAPSTANGATQLTALAVLETVVIQWQGDSGYPTTTTGTGARGYGDSSTNLNSDIITITIPTVGALGYQTRGSLAAIKLTPVNSAAAPVTPLPPYGQAVTNSAPLAYWRLNELIGATIAGDYFGNNNGAIGSNVTTAVSGPQNPSLTGFETNNLAMLLGGVTNSYLTMPALNVNTNTVTIAGWINPAGNQNNGAGIVFCRGGATAAGLGFPSGGGNELRYTWNGLRSDVSTGLAVPTNEWSFFALVVTPSAATVYLGTNGVLNSFADSASLPAQAFDAPLRIGFDPGTSNRLFNGRIDEIAFYNRALTLAQVQSLYFAAAGCPVNPSIVGGPTNQTVASGTTAAFSVNASGPTVLSYQWQVSTNGGASFANVGGATSSSYTTPITALPYNGNQYRVIVSGLCGTPATSVPATLTVTPAPLPGYGLAITNSAPLAYWRLNETNGASIAGDYYGVYDGTIGAGIAGGIDGPRNPPLTGFEANNTGMQLNFVANSILTMPVFNLNTNTVTMVAWIKPNGIQAGASGLIFCRGGTTVAGLNFASGNPNELRYTWNNDRFGVGTGLVVPTNQWSFVALVVTPTGATIYMGTNGVLNSFTDSVSLPVQAFAAPLLIGSDPASGGRLFKGQIDEIALYSRSLTPIQIQQLYAGGAGCPGTPAITNQPASQTVLSGSTATFVVGTTVPTVLGYQWRISTNGGSSFANIGGALNASYTTPVLTSDNNGSQYQVVVSGVCGSPVTSAVATLAVEFGSYPRTVTNILPVAYWRLNETNGAAVAADFFGVYNGTIGAGITAGVTGPQSPAYPGFETGNRAMRLNFAANSILTMPAMNLNTNTVTITAWVNPDGLQADAAGLIFCRGGTTTAGLNFPSGGGNELRYTWNGFRFNVGTGLVLPSNQWSFIALVVSPEGATMYLGTNGVLNSFVDAVATTNQAFDAPLLLGSDPAGGGRLFKGKIDEVAIYNRSLTLTQIQQLYVNGGDCLGNPSITSHPAGQIVPSGGTAAFTVAATGPTILSYQWQVSTNGGASFVGIGGATNTSYTTPVLGPADNGNQYRALASGLCGPAVPSAPATLSVISFSLESYGREVTNGSPIAYWRLNEPPGATVAYDFFRLRDGAVGPGATLGVSGPQGPQFPGLEANNTAVQLNYATDSIVTMPALNLNTNSVTIVGWLNPTGLQVDAAGLVFCRGGTTTAGLNFPSGGGNELRYTWGIRIGGSTGLVVPTNQWSFFALVVTPGGATVYLSTNGLLNSVADSVVLPSQAFDAPLLIGYDPVSGARLFKGGIDEVAVYNRALTAAELQRLSLTGAGCPGNPMITSQPTNQTVIAGSIAEFSVAATGPTLLSYQWQSSTNGGASFATVSGATNANYSTPPLTVENSGTQYRALASDLCGTAATSTVATLTVNPPPALAGFVQGVTNNSPFAYWRLNEGNGATVAHDFFGVFDGSIGSGVTAGINGPQNPPFAGFESNNVAMLLGSAGSSYLTMPALNLNTNSVTITGWIKPTGVQADWTGIVFCRGGGTIAGLNFGSGGNNELRYTWDGARFDVSTGLTVPTNQWSFFALVVSPTNATILLGANGVLNSFKDNIAQPAQTFAGALLAGYDPASGTRLFKGSLDEVAVYDHSLTVAQLQQLYIGGLGCPGEPSVTVPPANQAAVLGSSALFSVTATAPTSLSYQWQVSTNGGANFADMSGANGTNYMTPDATFADDGTQYRVVVSGLCGSPVTSAVATLSVELGSYAQTVASNSPLAYWRLNETNGAPVALDSAGAYDGGINPGVVGGISGPRSPSFPGFETANTAMLLSNAGSRYLTMPAFHLNTNVVTITGWINPTGTQVDWAAIVFCRSGATAAGLNFNDATTAGYNELRYTWNGLRYDVHTGLVIPVNQWSFFALVATPTSATVYLGTNGVLNSFTDSIPLPFQSFDASLLIGRDAFYGRGFNGGIDEVAIYGHALTLEQIQGLYENTGYVPPSLTPFQMWQLDRFGCTDCSQAGSGADPDGDGLGNEQEYLAGTNPNNPSSTLKITGIDRIGSDIRITWTTVEAHSYVLQTNAAPTSSGFTDFSPTIVVPPGTGESSTNYLDTGTGAVGPSRYYRVRLAP